MRLEFSPWINRFEFHITGKGDELIKFEELQCQSGYPKVIVHGRLTLEKYTEVLNLCNVGLALKLPDGPLANTTFPSKILEYINEELLILTTDISDVRFLLNENAIYTTGDIEDLILKFKFIINNTLELSKIKCNAKIQLQDKYSQDFELRELHRFLFQKKYLNVN